MRKLPYACEAETIKIHTHTHLEPQGLGANQMSPVNPDGQHDFVVILHSLSALGFSPQMALTVGLDGLFPWM